MGRFTLVIDFCCDPSPTSGTCQQISDEHIQHIERIILCGNRKLACKRHQRGRATLFG